MEEGGNWIGLFSLSLKAFVGLMDNNLIKGEAFEVLELMIRY